MGSNFKVNIKIDSVNEILKRHGLQDNGPALSFVTFEFARHSDPYVPAKSNSMKNSVQPNTPKIGQIYYKGPYARIHYHGKVMIDPKYKVGGFYNKKTGKWFSRTNVKKVLSNRNFKYNGAPKRGPYWDKRMWNDKGKEICKSLEDFIKRYGK